MNKQLPPNKYAVGDEVYSKVSPTLKLLVRRYIDRIYFCRVQENPKADELAYFERELL